MGKYKVMTGEFADLMLGYYGECIGERNPEVVEIAKTQAKKDPITVRPADLLPPEWDKLEADAAKLDGFNGSEEDVLTNAMFPGVAPKFFVSRPEGPKSVGKTQAQLDHEKAIADGSAKAVRGPIKYNVTVAGRTHSVQVEPA